jgi:membrane associated rhomboid family serine protease
MTNCASCGREFEASSDTETRCQQCAAEQMSGYPGQQFSDQPARPFSVKPAQQFSVNPARQFSDSPAGPAPSRLRQAMDSPTIVLIALNTLVYLIMAVEGHRFLTFDSQLLLHWGANAGALTSGGQWWRLVTSTFEHGGLLHIALNMWCLYNLGWLAELLFGRTRFTLLYLLCGIGGSLGSICWHGNGVSVGASGAIFGVAGALIPAMLLHHNQRLRALLKGQLTSIALFVFYNLAFGAAASGIDTPCDARFRAQSTPIPFQKVAHHLPCFLWLLERRKVSGPAHNFQLCPADSARHPFQFTHRSRCVVFSAQHQSRHLNLRQCHPAVGPPGHAALHCREPGCGCVPHRCLCALHHVEPRT